MAIWAGIGDLDPTSNGPIAAVGVLAHVYGADGVGSTLLLGTGAPAGFTYALSGGGTVLDGQPDPERRQRGRSPGYAQRHGRRAYTVTQLHAIDHTTAGNENDQFFTFNYRVTDGNGDTIDGTLGLTVNDDSPVVSANAPINFDEDALTGGNLGGTGDLNPVPTARSPRAGPSRTICGADGAGTLLLVPTGGTAGFTYAVNGDGTVLTISQLQGGSNVSVLQVVLTDQYVGQLHGHPASCDQSCAGSGRKQPDLYVQLQCHRPRRQLGAGTVSLTVNDDTPVALSGTPTEGQEEGPGTFGTVYEDGLEQRSIRRQFGRRLPDHLVSDPGGGSAELCFVRRGSNRGPFVLNPGATAPLLFSHGIQIVYSVNAGGDTLTATAGTQTVFTLHDNGNQTFTFRAGRPARP